MDTLRTKRFRAESICLVFQNIQHRTEYSHLCLPPGLQSLPVLWYAYGVFRTKDESAQSSPRSQYERG